MESVTRFYSGEVSPTRIRCTVWGQLRIEAGEGLQRLELEIAAVGAEAGSSE